MMKAIFYLFVLLMFSISVFAQNLSFVDITSDIKVNETKISDGKTPWLLDDKNTMLKVTSLFIILVLILWIVSYRANQKRMHERL